MLRQQKTESKDWQRRREQYLRESGRQVDLVNEGYQSAGLSFSWTVFAGGRVETPLALNPATRPFLVKGRIA